MQLDTSGGTMIYKFKAYVRHTFYHDEEIPIEVHADDLEAAQSAARDAAYTKSSHSSWDAEWEETDVEMLDLEQCIAEDDCEEPIHVRCDQTVDMFQ